MRAQDVANCLKQLKETYQFGEGELKLLKEIEDCVINSVAYTVDGGFDLHTGEFHPEERTVCYKVRIKYKSSPQVPEKFMLLMAVNDCQENRNL